MLYNWSDKTLDKREAIYRVNYKPIKFHNSIKITSLQDIFFQLFKERRTTYYLNNNIHCGADCNRSVIDAFLLTMHYFSKVSFKEVYRILQSTKRLKFHFFWCPDIKKTVCNNIFFPFQLT